MPSSPRFVGFPLNIAKRRMAGAFVYILYLDNTPVYVGHSACIISRIKQHQARAAKDKEFQFDSVAVKKCRSVIVARLEERRLIRLHQPRNNSQSRDRLSFAMINLHEVLNLPKPKVELERRF